MTLPVRSFLLTLISLAFVVLAPAHAQAAVTIGIGDQKAEMWQDPRLKSLGLKHARLVVAYDRILRKDFTFYDAWIGAAQVRGVDVVVAFNHSSRSHKALPSVAQYRRVIRNFRARYPHVRTMTTWNEANHLTQPTFRNPKRAAQYYNALRQECSGCKIVAADVLDQSNMVPWLKTFKRYAVRPKVWGLHNYKDANRNRPFRNSGTAQFLRTVKGEVWLTETGGIVRFAKGTTFRGGVAAENAAARATARTFALANMSSRIKRVYLYQWSADPRFINWDSGLVDSVGRARPALHVLRAQVNRQRRSRGLPAVPPLAAKLGVRLPLF